MTLSNPIGFLLKEKYDNYVTDCMLDTMLYFIKDFLGESEESDSASSSNSHNSSKLNSDKLSSMMKKQDKTPPMVH